MLISWPDCQDKSPACPGWQRWCRTYPQIKQQCPKTCGTCEYFLDTIKKIVVVVVYNVNRII